MSIEKVRAYMRQFNIEDRIIEFSTSSATVELAAQAAGCEPARIAKTLSFKLNDNSCVLIVAAGSPAPSAAPGPAGECSRHPAGGPHPCRLGQPGPSWGDFPSRGLSL